MAPLPIVLETPQTQPNDRGIKDYSLRWKYPRRARGYLEFLRYITVRQNVNTRRNPLPK